MNRVAMPCWQGRISPVFDVAQELLVVDVSYGVEVERHKRAILAETLDQRVAEVVQSGATFLICGAISRPLEMLLVRRGVRVLSQVCGEIDPVLRAYLQGDLSRHGMPGCRANRHRFRGGRGQRR